jgi:hypothetical protein
MPAIMVAVVDLSGSRKIRSEVLPRLDHIETARSSYRLRTARLGG